MKKGYNYTMPGNTTPDLAERRKNEAVFRDIVIQNQLSTNYKLIINYKCRG